MEEKAIAISQPATLIEMALSRGADEKALEKLEKVLELQERWEMNEAKKAYVKAMAKFKSNPPEILKTETVMYTRKDGRVTKFDHAALDRVSAAINIGLSEHGLYARWSMEQPDPKLVRVTCTVTHELGHSEHYTTQAPPDESDGKNPIQAMSSTNTYLERISLLGITGLAAKGMDNDGIGSDENTAGEYITEEQLSKIVDMINDKEVDEKKFCQYMKIESLDKMPQKDFSRAMTALKEKVKK